MEVTDSAQVLLERVLEDARQHGHPVLVPLAGTHGDLMEGEVEVLDPETERFLEPEPSAIEQRRDELGRSFHLVEQPQHLSSTEDHGKSLGPLGPDGVEVTELAGEDVAVEEGEGARSLAS